MGQFEQLQELWQQQPQPRMAPVDGEALTRAFARYGRRQDWINIAKIVAIATVMVWELAHLRRSALSLAGLAMVAAVAATLVAIDWRSQRVISRLNFAEPSAAFVRTTIGRLMEQRDPFRKYCWPFMLTMVAAMNLMFWSTLGSNPTWSKYAWHFIGSGMPFPAYAVGRRFRIQRFEAECRPLVDRMVRMLEALEEYSE